MVWPPNPSLSEAHWRRPAPARQAWTLILSRLKTYGDLMRHHHASGIWACAASRLAATQKAFELDAQIKWRAANCELVSAASVLVWFSCVLHTAINLSSLILCLRKSYSQQSLLFSVTILSQEFVANLFEVISPFLIWNSTQINMVISL